MFLNLIKKKWKNFFILNLFSLFFILTLLYFISLESVIETALLKLNLFSWYFHLILIIYNFIWPILLFFIFDIKIKQNFIRHIYYFLISIYYLFLLFLVLYLLRTRLVFDIYFFIYNFHDAIPTAINVIGVQKFVLIVIFFLLFLFSFFLFLKRIEFLRLRIKSPKYFKIIFYLISCIFIVINIFVVNNDLILTKFFKRLFQSDYFVRKYDKSYNNLLRDYSNIDINDFVFDKNADADIYFLHLESVNNKLVSNKLTPQLLKYANHYGVRFTNFISNTVQTLRAEESILCALPPSMDRYLNNVYDVSKLTCLPKIFNKLDYDTFFFKSHSLDYTHTGDFMQKIGFSEIHNQDIMKSGDQELYWGYKEDIFYQRVWEYLQTKTKKHKFVYVAVSSTNHCPFDTNHFSGNLPFNNIQNNLIQDPNHKNFLRKMSNAVYIQDYYLGEFLERLIKDQKKKYIFIYSDNAWPVALHKNNIFNENLAYEENFSIPLVFIAVGDNRFKKGGLSNDYYSQIDIFNTVLDLFDVKTNLKFLGNSFFNNLLKNNKETPVNNRCIISIQPFSDKYFSFIKDNIHYIYNTYTKEFFNFNLKKDPKEINKILTNNFQSLFNSCISF